MGRTCFLARLIRSLTDCLGIDTAGKVSEIDVPFDIPNNVEPGRTEPDVGSGNMPDADPSAFALHPARPVDHLSPIVSVIETEKIGDIPPSEKKHANCHVPLHQEVESVTHVDSHQDEEVERERIAARRKLITSRVKAARLEKEKEKRKKTLASKVSKQLQLEMERERADAVGALLVAEEEEEALRIERAEKPKKVHDKKIKKKAKELKRKASKKMQSESVTWQPLTVATTDDAAIRAATLAMEEAKAKEAMERLRAAERAFASRATGRGVGEGGVEGESKSYLKAVVQGGGVQQHSKAFEPRGVLPRECRSPRLARALLTTHHRR